VRLGVVLGWLIGGGFGSVCVSWGLLAYLSLHGAVMGFKQAGK
jgi:hypothetical protein